MCGHGDDRGGGICVGCVCCGVFGATTNGVPPQTARATRTRCAVRAPACAPRLRVAYARRRAALPLPTRSCSAPRRSPPLSPPSTGDGRRKTTSHRSWAGGAGGRSSSGVRDGGSALRGGARASSPLARACAPAGRQTRGAAAERRDCAMAHVRCACTAPQSAPCRW